MPRSSFRDVDDIADTTECEALPLAHYEYHEFEL